MNSNKKRGLPSPKNQAELLDMYYLEARSHLVETAAIFDRIQRASDGGKAMYDDPRIQTLCRAAEIIIKGDANRVEQFLLHCSGELPLT